MFCLEILSSFEVKVILPYGFNNIIKIFNIVFSESSIQKEILLSDGMLTFTQER